MTDIDLDKLEALADTATHGPWTYEGVGFTDDGGQYREVTSPAEIIFGEWSGPSEENAAFIAAANPATIKSLIASAREAAAEIERLRKIEAIAEIMDRHLGEDDRMWTDDSTISTEWIGSDGVRRSLTFGMFRQLREALSNPPQPQKGDGG